MKQFDVPDKKADAALSEAEAALRDLMDGLDMGSLACDGNGDGDEDEWLDALDEDDGMASSRTEMSAAKVEELEASLMLARLVLAKVTC